jgi:formylglycine-generating enzyme required for sulfatase activity
MKAKQYFLFLFYLLIQQVAFSQLTDTAFKPYEQMMPGSALKFKMTPVKGGSFTMGSPETETGRSADEGPQKTFSISSFWMGIYEVTHDEFDIFLKMQIPVRTQEQMLLQGRAPVY